MRVRGFDEDGVGRDRQSNATVAFVSRTADHGVGLSSVALPALRSINIDERLMDRFVGVALSHQFAALLAVGVKMVALGRRHELTDLVQASRRQPPLAPASLDGKAVRCLFIWTSELVTALVGVNPEFDRCGLDGAQQLRVDDEKAWVGGRIVVERIVEHCRSLPANSRVTVNFEGASRNDLSASANLGYV